MTATKERTSQTAGTRPDRCPSCDHLWDMHEKAEGELYCTYPHCECVIKEKRKPKE